MESHLEVKIEEENETKEVVHNALLMSGVALFFALPWFFLNS